jgi:hypothetical protein
MRLEPACADSIQPVRLRVRMLGNRTRKAPAEVPDPIPSGDFVSWHKSLCLNLLELFDNPDKFT